MRHVADAARAVAALTRIVLRTLGIHAATVVDTALLADVGHVFFKFNRFQLNFGLGQFFNFTDQPNVALGHKSHRQA